MIKCGQAEIASMGVLSPVPGETWGRDGENLWLRVLQGRQALLDGFQFPFEGRNFIWRGPGSRCTSGFERDQSLKGIFPAESGSPPAGIPTPPAKSEAPGTASAPAQPRAAWTPTPPCTRPHSPWSARIKSWHSYSLLFLWPAPGAHHRRVKRCQPGRKDAKNG